MNLESKDLKAELVGNNTIIFSGKASRHRTPVFNLCRELIKKEIKGILSVYRGATLSMAVNIEEAAKLSVEETVGRPLRFCMYKPFRYIPTPTQK